MKKLYFLNEDDQRQKNITSVFCKRNSNGTLTIPGHRLDGTLWSDYAKKYKVTQTEIEVSLRTCPQSLDVSTQQKNNQQKMYQQRAQQVTKQTQDLTKQIQALLGLEKTGNMDTGLLQKINTKLNGGK
jgi:outer membrane receptor for ferric coprogen and ferric-rhodotorulic acid